VDKKKSGYIIHGIIQGHKEGGEKKDMVPVPRERSNNNKISKNKGKNFDYISEPNRVSERKQVHKIK